MNENETRDDLMRQLIDLAVRSGRSRQSPQTGYLHYYPGTENEKHDSIPLVQNVLFVLSLLRSRIAENVLEAKTLLDGLLHFQSHDGNFPIYLHEYPRCKNRLLGVDLLPPFYWILKSFHHVLGNELKARLETAASGLMRHCLATIKEKAAPYTLTLKIGASAAALGSFFNEKATEESGEEILDELRSIENPASWDCPAEIAEALLCLRMVFPSIKNSPWSRLWSHTQNTWHPSTSTYIGPAVKEFQYGEEPQLTLYDLLLGYLAGHFSQRALTNRIVHLQGALIQPSQDTLSKPSYPFSIEGSIDEHCWRNIQTENYAYSVLGRGLSPEPAHERGISPFRLIWGNPKRTHTFVFQNGNVKQLQFHANEEKVELYFKLEGDLSEDREKSREIPFYFDMHEEAQVLVNGTSATTFQLDDDVTVNSGSLKITLRFSLEQGNGRFFGHIMPGNRPAQQLKGFQAYDTQVFLRTLDRDKTSPCIVKATIILKS